MRGEQFQRIYNAGCAGISESRGFHFDVTSRPDIGIFSRLDGGDF
jgi:hypothetical protein